MKPMDKNLLMDQLAQRGYALMQPKSTEPAEKLFANLLSQSDARLLEGFPVVFANVLAENKPLEWESEKWQPDELTLKVVGRLQVMLTVSYLLFELFGMPKEYSSRVSKLLTRLVGTKEMNKYLERYKEPLLQSQSVKLNGVSLSTERLKNNFRNYVVQSPGSAEVQEKKHALELELLLAELFTPRQKEVLRKRMEGKPLTKTEREYFYRVVKKRLRALASDELHQMARTLLLK